MRSPTLKVTKKIPELISPAQPTPNEFKHLSDIDDQQTLRCYIPFINFYERNPSMSMEGKDPVKIIRDAIAKALVFYYPLAGRLREYDGRKLVVECTGQGVVFVEADADVMLHHFGDTLNPPFPNLKDLLLDAPGSHQITNCPLLLIQVTRLKCGGFIFAYRVSHTMCDATGFFQFISAVGEIARGGAVPSVAPVWERHLLFARCPPRVSFRHPEYDVVPESDSTSAIQTQLEEWAERNFFFSAADISALRRTLPPHLQGCSRFDVVAGCAWRCWTIALSPEPDEEVRFLCAMDVRKRMRPQLPVGYYGNAIAFPTAVTTAVELLKNPLEYAVELIRKAKDGVTDEYLRSAADMLVMRGRPSWTAGRMTYRVSDMTRGDFGEVDLGWGAAAYGGMAEVIYWAPSLVSWYVAYKDKMGERGTMVPISLPPNSMHFFHKQLQMMITAAATTSAL